MNQLLEALLIQSANDAAADLADAVAGTRYGAPQMAGLDSES